MRRVVFVTVGAVRAVPISAGVLAVLLLAPTGCSQPQGMSPVTPSTSLVTSTTKIASAGVLGNQRRPDESCAAEPVPAEPGEGTRRVASGTDRGEVDVPVDPARIVALDAGQLDAEIQSNGWLVAPADPEIVFDGDNDSKWLRAMRAIGVDPSLLSTTAGHA